MRKHFIIMMAAVAMLFVPSCTENDTPEEGKQQPEVKNLTAPTLSADADIVRLWNYDDEAALNVTWNDIAPSGVSVAYSLEFALASEEEFKPVSKIDCSSAGKNLTANELSKLAVDLTADMVRGVDVAARVTATASGYDAVSSNIVKFRMRKITDIYPIGAVYDWGWDLSKTQPMDTEDGINYAADLYLWAQADWKFACQNDAWWPDFTRDANAEDYFTAIFNDGSLPDTQFQVLITGMYRVTLNVETCKMTVEGIPE